MIEPLSRDEAYLDVTENLQGIASAAEIAERIRARVRAETQLTASAGVSCNKFLAKFASDHRKPNGLFHEHGLGAWKSFLTRSRSRRFAPVVKSGSGAPYPRFARAVTGLDG
jgi:nucleotidyltransferase/DNA polymerase involved in DNA repair